MRKLFNPATSLAFILVLFFVAMSAHAEVTRTLYAGQYTPVGTLTVSEEGDILSVVYEMYDGWCLDTTHLYVSTDPPRKASPGKFPYKHEDPPCAEDVYEIELSKLGVGVGDTLIIAAHADVVYKGGTKLDGILPEDPVQMTAKVGKPVDDPSKRSYFDEVEIEGAGHLDGTYEGWCGDPDKTIPNEGTYDVIMESSYEVISDPAEAGLVNYILNHKDDWIGKPYNGGDYTWGSIQRAVWGVLGLTYNGEDPAPPGSPAWQIIQDAIAAGGESFVPECGDMIAVYLLGENDLQPVIILIPFPCDETAWAFAEGDTRFRTGWGRYFTYVVGAKLAPPMNPRRALLKTWASIKSE